MYIFYTSDGRRYEGMSQETVQGLLDDANLTCTFVDKEAYDTIIAALRPSR
jgi:hypothetical protein